MHPIELLRYVAREGRSMEVGELAAETAWGLAEIAVDDPAGLVVSVRRLLERRPEAGPLWWVASRVLTASDAKEAAFACARELRADSTDHLVDDALHRASPPEILEWSSGSRRSDGVTVIGCLAVARQGALVRSGTRVSVRAAGDAGCSVWLKAPVGTMVPELAWLQIVELCSGDGRVEMVPLGFFDRAFGPRGEDRPELIASGCDWSLPPELTGIVSLRG